MSRKKKSDGMIQTELLFDDNLLSCLIVSKGSTIRVPIIDAKKINDPNRILMIKFKYGISTREEETQLYENIKNLIFKAMHKNNVMMPFEDVCQEIWKKIIKSKHTWNELKGTRVSTWIVVVANSVINTLRKEVAKYNSRYCLYEDLNSEKDGDETDDIESSVALKNHVLDEDYDVPVYENSFTNFYNDLTPKEKRLVDMAFKMSDKNAAKNYNRGKISVLSLRRKLGIDQNAYDEIISGMKEKFYSHFD